MKNKIIGYILIITLLISVNSNFVFASDSDMERLTEVMNIITENYKDDVSQSQLIDGAIQGMFQSLDPHSYYLKQDEYNNLINSLSGEFSGIGVNIEKNGKYIEVVEVIKDSPAQKVGIQKGDRFISVDKKSVVDIEIDVFVSLVRGPKGTNVEVEILRVNNNKPLSFMITRNEIEMINVDYDVLGNNIGYIRITSFSENSSNEFIEVLKELDKRNIDKVIIDLRGNPGGYLNEVVSMCKYIIPSGPIVHIKQNNEDLHTYSSKLQKSNYNIVVLVDGGSASASEILAGAIQDTKSGTLIGTKTYGKGTVQTFFELENGDYVKLSIANYLTPNKRSIDGLGLTPDIIVEGGNEVIGLDDFNITRNIYVGKSGQDILYIERMLLAMGYIDQNPDEIYDGTTSEGVMRFKKDNNLLPNNIINIYAQRLMKEKYKLHKIEDKQLNKAINLLTE